LKRTESSRLGWGAPASTATQKKTEIGKTTHHVDAKGGHALKSQLEPKTKVENKMRGKRIKKPKKSADKEGN